MGIKDRVKSAMANNPLNKLRIRSLRRQLKNKDFTLLTPNCLGGILYHDLGLRFVSPTINLEMTQKDFLEFVLHLEDYLDGEFSFVQSTTHNCPSAFLSRKGSDEKILVIFTHYKTEEEALHKWNTRKERINKDNIFVFIEERDGITKNDLLRLSQLKVKGVVAFTCNDYKDIPYSVYLPKYKKDCEVGNILKKNHLTGSREYEKYFDFVKWVSEANGSPYEISKFCK